MLEIISNGSKWMCQKPEPLEELYRMLQEHPLDPTFEDYGNFVNRNPQWEDKTYAKKYAGCTCIFGNFFAYSHVFYIITDDEAIIARVEELVAANKQMPEYIEASQCVKWYPCNDYGYHNVEDMMPKPMKQLCIECAENVGGAAALGKDGKWYWTFDMKLDEECTFTVVKWCYLKNEENETVRLWKNTGL